VERFVVMVVPVGARPIEPLRAAAARLLPELDPERPPQPENLDALLADPAARLVLAVAGEAAPAWPELEEAAILGMLTLTFRNSLTRTSGHIDHVVVDPRHRRRGIGTAMLARAIEVARSAGASRIDLTSSAARPAAAPLYLALGFERRETENWRRRL
jgi:GNAT superfamily N-acetyltransferase